jgi:hypothetical protein
MGITSDGCSTINRLSETKVPPPRGLQTLPERAAGRSCCRSEKDATMTRGTPLLQIRHIESDSKDDWRVSATWPDGHSEEIAGFKNEAEANDWIANKFQAWLEEVDGVAAS